MENNEHSVCKITSILEQNQYRLCVSSCIRNFNSDITNGMKAQNREERGST